MNSSTRGTLHLKKRASRTAVTVATFACKAVASRALPLSSSIICHRRAERHASASFRANSSDLHATVEKVFFHCLLCLVDSIRALSVLFCRHCIQRPPASNFSRTVPSSVCDATARRTTSAGCPGRYIVQLPCFLHLLFPLHISPGTCWALHPLLASLVRSTCVVNSHLL